MALPTGTGGYKIKLLKNGQPVDEFTLFRQHSSSSKDIMTMIGSIKLALKKDDVISVQLAPEANADSKTYKYRVVDKGTLLSLKRIDIY